MAAYVVPAYAPPPQPPPPGYCTASAQLYMSYSVTAPTMELSGGLTDVPMQTTCPHCHATVTTTVDYEIGSLALIFGLVLAFIGCCLFSWIPFFMNSGKDVIHICPNCDVVVGRHNRL